MRIAHGNRYRRRPIVAIAIMFMLAACSARSGEVAASGASGATPTASPPAWQVERERRWKELSEQRLEQQGKPLEGLTDEQLFKELDEALSGERMNNVLNRLRVAGTLETADRLDALAARIRTAETQNGHPPSAGLLEYFAEEIRFHHTGDRKHQVRAALIITNPVDETLGSRSSSSHASMIVRLGIIETRANLVGLADRERTIRATHWTERDIEITRRAIMFLDIWEQAKTAEETFVRAVEQNDDLPLKGCAVNHLLELEQVSDSTRRRVREALLPAVEAAQIRMRTPKGSSSPSSYGVAAHSATSEDFANTCALYGFWLKHSKEELRTAEAERFFAFPSPCSFHYEEGARVAYDRCP